MTARCVSNNGTVWDFDHVCVKWFTQLFCTPISFTSFLCSSLQFPTTHVQTHSQYKKCLVFLSLVRVVKLVSLFYFFEYFPCAYKRISLDMTTGYFYAFMLFWIVCHVYWPLVYDPSLQILPFWTFTLPPVSRILLFILCFRVFDAY